jgi:hypothetical protein
VRQDDHQFGGFIQEESRKTSESIVTEQLVTHESQHLHLPEGNALTEHIKEDQLLADPRTKFRVSGSDGSVQVCLFTRDKVALFFSTLGLVNRTDEVHKRLR